MARRCAVPVTWIRWRTTGRRRRRRRRESGWTRGRARPAARGSSSSEIGVDGASESAKFLYARARNGGCRGCARARVRSGVSGGCGCDVTSCPSRRSEAGDRGRERERESLIERCESGGGRRATTKKTMRWRRACWRDKRRSRADIAGCVEVMGLEWTAETRGMLFACQGCHKSLGRVAENAAASAVGECETARRQEVSSCSIHPNFDGRRCDGCARCRRIRRRRPTRCKER